MSNPDRNLNNSKNYFQKYPSINKSNVTLWKSKYTDKIPLTQDHNLENEYIDNLKIKDFYMYNGCLFRAKRIC